MHSNDICRSIAHDAATDEWSDFVVAHWHHGNRSIGGQPVRFVITTGVIAHLVRVTEEEGHCAESLHTGACPA